MSPAAVRAKFKAAGLRVAIEKDPTQGWEFIVERYTPKGAETITMGWSAGTKSEALTEAFVAAKAAAPAFGVSL